MTSTVFKLLSPLVVESVQHAHSCTGVPATNSNIQNNHNIKRRYYDDRAAIPTYKTTTTLRDVTMMIKQQAHFSDVTILGTRFSDVAITGTNVE